MLDISVGGGVEIIITEQIYSHWKFLENIKGGKERRELHQCMKLNMRKTIVAEVSVSEH